MKALCVLQHVEAEYLGLLEDHFEGRNIRFRYCRPFTPGASIPASAEDNDGLVVLGAGPKGIVSGDLIPSLGAELRLTRDFLDRGLPVIGIGIGACILSTAAGGGAEEAPLRFTLDNARRIVPDALGGHLPAETSAASSCSKFIFPHTAMTALGSSPRGGICVSCSNAFVCADPLMPVLAALWRRYAASVCQQQIELTPTSKVYNYTEMDGPLESAEQTAYKFLRERIVSGRFPGGTPLRQERLAAELGLSRIPVRDAIRHLAVSGLVVFQSNRRAVVTLLDESDLSELFAMRSVLEGLAARHAVANLSEQDLDRLVWLANQMDQTERNVDLWMPLHVEFHELLCSRSNMPRLCAEITRLRLRVEPYVRVMTTLRGVAELRLSRHNSIIKAILGRDPDCAERTLREHVMQASREIRFSVRSSKLSVSLAGAHHTASEKSAAVVQRSLRRRGGDKK